MSNTFVEDDFITALNSEAQYDNSNDTVLMDGVYQEPEMSALSMLSFFETNKEQRASFVMQVIDDLQEGRKDPRLVHLQIKCMEDIINLLTDNKKYPTTAKAYKDLLLDECQKWGNSFDFHNSKFSIRGTGGKADYSQCNDKEVLQLEADFEAAKAKLDVRKKYLDNLPVKGIEQVDTTTGQIFTLYPPAKPKGESIVVNLS